MVFIGVSNIYPLFNLTCILTLGMVTLIYLGMIIAILKTLFKRVFKPVFKFIFNFVFRPVFKFLFNFVFKPLLIIVLKPALKLELFYYVIFIKSLFPFKKRKLLSKEEYEREAIEYTESQLVCLKKYCLEAPSSEIWQMLSSLSDPNR